MLFVLRLEQGGCKHAFKATDIHLLHPQDCNNAMAYPLLTHEVRSFRPACHSKPTHRALLVLWLVLLCLLVCGSGCPSRARFPHCHALMLVAAAVFGAQVHGL